MDEQGKKVNYDRLPADLKTKLASWEQNSPATQQLGVLRQTAEQLQEMVKLLGNQPVGGDIQKLAGLLGSIQGQLASLNTKEAPQIPDYAKPVVKALGQLQTTLTEAVKGLEVAPHVNVAAPQVTVPTPVVSVAAPDLSKIEQLLKTDLVKALDQAIAKIPQVEIPEADYSSLLLSLTGLSEQLASLETATRMKPLPGNMAIRVNGQNVSSSNPLPVDASVSVASAPTFKDDPTNAGEAPKYGKTNSSTHKQMVEADTGLSQPLTDTQLRASTLPVTEANSASIKTDLDAIAAKDFATQTTLALIKAKTDNIDVALSTRTKPADQQHVIVDSSASIAVTGPLTDTQLRATPVPVSGTVTANTGLSQPLTDTQLRASSVPTAETTGLVPKVYDYLSANFAGATADVYTYKTGGAGGSTTATLTVNWTDATKLVLSTVVRT